MESVELPVKPRSHPAMQQGCSIGSLCISSSCVPPGTARVFQYCLPLTVVYILWRSSGSSEEHRQLMICRLFVGTYRLDSKGFIYHGLATVIVFFLCIPLLKPFLSITLGLGDKFRL